MDSTQVTITPDKKDIYITLNVTEGEKYTVNEISFAGNLVVPESELRELFLIKSGDVFSRNKMIATKDLITRRLGNEGYAFAKVQVAPNINDETLTG